MIVTSAIASIAAGLVGGAQGAAPQRPDFSGAWVLNADLSDHPTQVGFSTNADGSDRGEPPSGARPGGGPGGFGGRGGAGGGGFGRGGRGGDERGRGQAFRENADDRLRVLELSDEIRNPSPTLTIVQHAGTFSVSDAQGRTRDFRTDGKKESHQLDAVKVDTKTTWDGDRLVTEYEVGSGRKIRYTYAAVSDEPRQLLVSVVFDTGKKESGHASLPIKHVYDIARASPVK